MTAQTKNVVTRNPERKLRKKIRNAKTEPERIKYESQLETLISRKQVNEVLKKQKLRKKQKITDDQAFQEAKKYNSSEEAKTKSKLTDLKETKKESVRQSKVGMKQKLKEKRKYNGDMCKEISSYDSKKNDVQEIIQECHERVLRKYKIQEIAKGENISLKEASDMLDQMLNQVQQMIENNQ